MDITQFMKRSTVQKKKKKKEKQNFDVTPPWNDFYGRPWMNRFRSNSWVTKRDSVWFNSFESLKNDKCQICQIP